MLKFENYKGLNGITHFFTFIYNASSDIIPRILLFTSLTVTIFSITKKFWYVGVVYGL